MDGPCRAERLQYHRKIFQSHEVTVKVLLVSYKARSSLQFQSNKPFPPQIILACLAAIAVAAPQEIQRPIIQILRDDRVDNGDGTFTYQFETENGIATDVAGQPGSLGQSNMQGSYR